jgi:predicted HD superfamily hydrolase involved in NAD metabolism
MPLSVPAGFTWTSAAERLDAFLRRRLSARRYEHSRAVARLCKELCGRFGAEADAGYFTGLGHDAAREMTEEELLHEVRAAGLEVYSYETEHPVLLHAPVSALVLRKMFGGVDEEVLEAVRRHTLGGPQLSLLGKILFVADYCEPGREFIGPSFREACFSLPLEGMLVYIIENEKARGHEPAPVTRAMYERLKKNMVGKKR